jgi:hypothetical protein
LWRYVKVLHQSALHRASADAQRLADGSLPSLEPTDPGQACVRYWGQTGKHLLGLSFTGFPNRTPAPIK